MRNLFTKLRYVPRHFAMAAAVMLAAVGTAATFAWGPDRPTYTMENAAPHVTFNSITNNPNYGDEREFVMVRDLTAGTQYGDEATLVPGHEYQVQVYVHNNAHESLNASGVGVAKNTTVRTAVPAYVSGTGSLDGFVRADNAKPVEVWDSVVLKSDGKVDLEFVSGSTHLSTHFQQTKLADEVLTTGVKVGDQDLSGDWRGCLEFAGIVTYKFKVKEQPTAEFTMDKQVRKHSTTTGGWAETYTAQPNEKVDFIIRYKNTGGVTQQNVVVKDALPAGLSYVTGSTILANSNQPNGAAVADGVTTTGINIGAYGPGANAWVRFSATVEHNDKLPACGVNTLKNVASVTTGAGTKQDSADVVVTRVCKEDKDITVCRLSDKKYPVTIKESEFDASKYSKNPDDCKVPEDKDITVCRLSDKKYPVTIKESEFDASKYSKNPDDCKVPEDKDITVCRLSDKKYPVTIKESEFDATKYSMNPDDCKVLPATYIKICDLTDWTIRTIKEEEFDADKHSKVLTDCKEKVCKIETKDVVTIDKKDFDEAIYTRDLAKCEEEPVTPPVTPTTPDEPKDTPAVLPSTGPASLLSGLFGSSALGLGITSFVRSRRALNGVIHQ